MKHTLLTWVKLSQQLDRVNNGPLSAGYNAGISKCNVSGGKWLILLYPDNNLYPGFSAVVPIVLRALRQQLSSNVSSSLQLILMYPLDLDASQANSLSLHILFIASISSFCSDRQRSTKSAEKLSIFLNHLSLSRGEICHVNYLLYYVILFIDIYSYIYCSRSHNVQYASEELNKKEGSLIIY